jgi:hypothetical protein
MASKSFRSEPEAERLKGRNKLYDAWVDRAGIEDLLGDRDLQAGGPPLALLDSSILRTIAGPPGEAGGVRRHLPLQRAPCDPRRVG